MSGTLTFTGWLSIVTICVLGAVSPGPSLVVVVRHSLAGSRLQGAACALSHATGVGLYALLTVLGLAVVVANHPRLYLALATGGGLYLAWLGVQALRTSTRPDPSSVEVDDMNGWPTAARDGFAIALLNPKITLFFLALFSQFVGPNPGVLEAIVLPLTAMGVDAAWYLLVALTLSGSGVLEGLRHGKGFSRIMGTALLAVAGWMMTRLWLG